MFTILYVDDETSLLDLGKLFLERDGTFRVETISSASGALLLLQVNRYDAIISDYLMPGMDGIDLLKKVRTSGSSIPFIIFTGQGHEETVIQALNEGADFYLRKSGDLVAEFIELSCRIIRAVGQRRALVGVCGDELQDSDGIYPYPGPPKRTCMSAILRGQVYDDVPAVKKYPGDLVPVLVKNTVTSDEQGDQSCPGSMQKIPGNRWADDAIFYSGEQFRTLFESAQEAIFLMEGSTLVRCNRRTVEMFGYEDEKEIIGCSPLEYSPVMQPDGSISRLKGQEIIRSAYAGIPQFFEWSHIRTDGRPFSAEVSLNCLTAGGKTVLKAIMRDISERKRAETELKKSEERYRLLFQNVNDGIIVHSISQDGHGQILDVNEFLCQILGFSHEELLNMSISDLYMHESLENIPVISTDLFSTKHAMFEADLLRSDGRYIPVEISSSLFELEGKPTVLAIVRDITERKMLENEMDHYTSEVTRYARDLQQANTKLNLMNRITRHDILNQLSVILGYLEITEEEFPNPQLQGYIGKEIHAARNIERQILFTKDYQDIGSQAPRWFDLRSIILLAAENLTLFPITLVIQFDSIEIYADPLIGKVFYTLLENAIRHGKTVTEIVFTCHDPGAGLIVVCEDNGEGVPAEYKEDIFEQKYFKHTGFGLFLSVTILNITGIEIRETGDPGMGARFEILVPRGVYR